MVSKLFKSVMLLVALLLVILLVLAFVVTENAPIVRQQGAPSPEDVVSARAVVKDVMFIARQGRDGEEPLIVNEQQLDSTILLGARFVPGFRGDVTVAPSGIEILASLPVPGLDRWINMAVTVPEFNDRFTLAHVMLGPVSIPPDVALEIGRIGANLISKDALGDSMMTAASGLRIFDDTAYVDLRIDEVGKNGIMRGVFGALRGGEMPGKDLVETYLVQIRDAMDRGQLPDTGSYLPYLVFTLEAAREGALVRGEAPIDAFTASIFALSNICGADLFFATLGTMSVTAPDDVREWQETCAPLTLNDRIDIRRHFTTAAALKAATNRNTSMSVGEYKELYDSLYGGFDFTDMAANNSGIRMAERFIATAPEDWQRLISRIEVEQDLIVAFDDIPQILSREDFTARFGSIEGERYRDVLDHIERKIDALALHAPL